MSIAAALLVSCGTTKTVPITGRHQSLMVSDDQVLSLSFQQYSEYMQSAKPSTNSTNTAMVKRVGQRIASAVESYLTQNGMAEEVKTYQWEFNLVQDKQVNAWCMPGGKIVVYEGLLPVTQDEASLAIVMGHEIAHAVARHSAERLSNAYKEQYGAAALSALMQGAGVSSGCNSWLVLFINMVEHCLHLVSRASKRARPTTSDLSLLPWLVTTLKWQFLSGSVCRQLLAAVPILSSLTTLLMPHVSSRFRDGCQRLRNIMSHQRPLQKRLPQRRLPLRRLPLRKRSKHEKSYSLPGMCAERECNGTNQRRWHHTTDAAKDSATERANGYGQGIT